MGQKRKKSKARQSGTGLPPSRVNERNRKCYGWLKPFGAGACLAALFAFTATHRYMSQPAPMPLRIDPVSSSAEELPWISDLVEMPEDQLGTQDLAMVNLVCAGGLPGAKELDASACLSELDEWARHVKQETDRHLYRVTDSRFKKLYNGSEAYYRVSMMLQVLHEDLGVRYNKRRVRDVDFTNSKDLFIHGMVGDKNGGTCVSMPVLFTAVGRRLGYPIKLALAKSHVYCRWDGPAFEQGDEQFNIEGSGDGFSSFDDDYYKTWPQPLTDKEIKSGQYLASLSPHEELAVFLAARGHCLEDTGQFSDCYLTYAQANRLAPENPDYAKFLCVVVMREHDAVSQAMLSAWAVEHLKAVDKINEHNRKQQLELLRMHAEPNQQTHQPGAYPIPIPIHR